MFLLLLIIFILLLLLPPVCQEAKTEIRCRASHRAVLSPPENPRILRLCGSIRLELHVLLDGSHQQEEWRMHSQDFAHGRAQPRQKRSGRGRARSAAGCGEGSGAQRSTKSTDSRTHPMVIRRRCLRGWRPKSVEMGLVTALYSLAPGSPW